ncbi:hypothetical protein KKH27_09430 [bacterium]|nr:hypothetical protein [bacterium]
MTKFSWWLGAGALLLASAAHGITVDGYVRIWGFHDVRAWIHFHAQSPSARSDSTRSDGWAGYFSIELQPGVYDVVYSFANFAPYRLPDQVLLFDTTLPPVELYQALSGPLSGDFGYDWVQIVDSISVEAGQTLTIYPGARLLFEPRAKFVVRGR